VNTQKNLLAIGIPTFNRKEYVKLCAESLSHAVDIDCCTIVIFDDNSSDFDVDYLKKYSLQVRKLFEKMKRVAGQIS
jgi:glycosyltransferase involved in cell wall biosynthesis